MSVRSERVVTKATQSMAFLYLRRRVLNGTALLAGDLLALEVSLRLAGALRRLLFGELFLPSWSGLLAATWLLGAYLNKLLPSWGLGVVEEVRRIIGLVALVFGVTILAIVLVGQGGDFSRLVLGLGALIACPLVLTLRYVVRRVLMRAQLWGVPTIVYGAHEGVIAALQATPGLGYLPVGVFDDVPDGRVLGVPVLGPLQAINLGQPVAPVAIVALPQLKRAEFAHLLEGTLRAYRKVVVVSAMADLPSLWAMSVDMGGILGLELTRNLLDPTARLLKRAFDLTSVLVTAACWVPLCLLLALGLWLETRTSPLFLQERVGEDGRQFFTWKFRTMVPNAEQVLERHLAQNPALRAEWETHFKLRVDPRITRLGALLRKTSLDELPQLVNVLRGEMSLVGPRPLPAYHESQLLPRTRQIRAQVQPGMTGLWQVSGRSAAGNAGMERWDPYYVRNWSLWLDLVILARTLKVVVLGSGAY
ncbi:exopolysaccharide biosynthesis polyprenyl glycosylphosphotransferase (plasmid) [Deinococcus taeanensis]|nr:exopolysaccharide biosynthesis polyprenyl glycosylphosphotransferase [Deinococcus taeanensis]UBV44429.1 exopolysaccharide biosynthesis polyprenyl glycosylphosphotransferase [Deinococcus taeanensis]